MNIRILFIILLFTMGFSIQAVEAQQGTSDITYDEPYEPIEEDLEDDEAQADEPSDNADVTYEEPYEPDEADLQDDEASPNNTEEEPVEPVDVVEPEEQEPEVEEEPAEPIEEEPVDVVEPDEQEPEVEEEPVVEPEEQEPEVVEDNEVSTTPTLVVIQEDTEQEQSDLPLPEGVEDETSPQNDSDNTTEPAETEPQNDVPAQTDDEPVQGSTNLLPTTPDVQICPGGIAFFDLKNHSQFITGQAYTLQRSTNSYLQYQTNSTLIAYFPNDGFYGVDTFAYTQIDEQGDVLYNPLKVEIRRNCSEEELSAAKQARRDYYSSLNPVEVEEDTEPTTDEPSNEEDNNDGNDATNEEETGEEPSDDENPNETEGDETDNPVDDDTPLEEENTVVPDAQVCPGGLTTIDLADKTQFIVDQPYTLEASANSTLEPQTQSTLLVYLPNDGFVGVDSFSYQQVNEEGKTLRDALHVETRADCSEAELSDAAQAKQDYQQEKEANAIVLAEADEAVACPATATEIDIAHNDPITENTEIILSLSDNAKIVDNKDGTLTYTPKDFFLGTDVFHYTRIDTDYNRTRVKVTVEVSEDCGESDQPSEAICQIYAVHDEGVSDSQLVTIDPVGFQTVALGDVYKEHDIEGMAIDPTNYHIYAVSGSGASPEERKGNLYLVDPNDGRLTIIGNTGHQNHEIAALAFDPEGGLWGWAEKQGLVFIDKETAQTTLVGEFALDIEGLAWSVNAQYLYGSEKTTLWGYETATDTFEPRCTNLPGEVEALEALNDGMLLLAFDDGGKDAALHVFDPFECKTLINRNYDTPYPDIESITWPLDCQPTETVTSWRGRFSGEKEKAVCHIDSQWLTTSGRVRLEPYNSHAYLRVGWRAVAPDLYQFPCPKETTSGQSRNTEINCRSWRYQTEIITGEVNFNIRGWWVGLPYSYRDDVKLEYKVEVLDMKGERLDGFVSKTFVVDPDCPRYTDAVKALPALDKQAVTNLLESYDIEVDKFDDTGEVHFTLNGTHYRGVLSEVLDTRIDNPDATVSIVAAGDPNEDGQTDFIITYPNGYQQYFYHLGEVKPVDTEPQASVDAEAIRQFIRESPYSGKVNYKGEITLTLGDEEFRGVLTEVLDIMITPAPNVLEVRATEDVDNDGNSDFIVVYPNGVQQRLLRLDVPSDESTPSANDDNASTSGENQADDDASNNEENQTTNTDDDASAGDESQTADKDDNTSGSDDETQTTDKGDDASDSDDETQTTDNGDDASDSDDETQTTDKGDDASDSDDEKQTTENGDDASDSDDETQTTDKGDDASDSDDEKQTTDSGDDTPASDDEKQTTDSGDDASASDDEKQTTDSGDDAPANDESQTTDKDDSTSTNDENQITDNDNDSTTSGEQQSSNSGDDATSTSDDKQTTSSSDTPTNSEKQSSNTAVDTADSDNTSPNDGNVD